MVENIEKIEKRIMHEVPVLVLKGRSLYGEWKEKEIYLNDLKNMAMGEEITVGSNIIRQTRLESIKCIYRDEKGILLYHVIKIWGDQEKVSPDEVKEELLYFIFHF
jgi:hypothetical protein